MAQTGFTPILIYSSNTASQTPSASNLTNSTLGSELAINITDGKLFYKDNANVVQVIGWKLVPTSAGGTGLTSFTANGVFYASNTTTIANGNNFVFDGTNVGIGIGTPTTNLHVVGSTGILTRAASNQDGVALVGRAGGTSSYEVTLTPTTLTADRTQTLPDGTGVVVVNGVNGSLVSGTAVASTSGASIDFTGIPSWVKRITIMFSGVSTTGTSQPMFQLGDSGGIETSGYVTAATSITSGGANAPISYTNGWQIFVSNAARVVEGNIVISLLNSATNTWSATGQFASELPTYLFTAGTKSLSATLDRVRITTAGGTDTFDAGTINILYE